VAEREDPFGVEWRVRGDDVRQPRQLGRGRLAPRIEPVGAAAHDGARVAEQLGERREAVVAGPHLDSREAGLPQQVLEA